MQTLEPARAGLQRVLKEFSYAGKQCLREPVHLAAKHTIGANGVVVDFDGNSGMSKLGINVPLVCAKAYAYYA